MVLGQFINISSVTHSCPTLCNPMNRSTPGLPVHHQLPEFTQTHVHRVGDTIHPFHPLSFPSPPAPSPSQHQGLFQWVNSWHEVAKSTGVSALAAVLPKNTQDWSPLRWTGWISLHEFGKTPGVGDGQGGLACCDSWGCKESDMTEQLNWTELNHCRWWLQPWN